MSAEGMAAFGGLISPWTSGTVGLKKKINKNPTVLLEFVNVKNFCIVQTS
uniref:Uncharacterized protein n=1 Tax=Anguilla anguilla TaxID=7936 RepID=A0A0E9SD95_ANGAN